METQNYHELLYQRAKEVQPQIESLVKAFEVEGLSQEEILLEISVALINEGYRLHELNQGVKIAVPYQRKLQTNVDTNIKE